MRRADGGQVRHLVQGRHPPVLQPQRHRVSQFVATMPLLPLTHRAAELNTYDEVDKDVLQNYIVCAAGPPARPSDAPQEFSLANNLYYAMLENAASEQSARMSAMDNASSNAGARPARDAGRSHVRRRHDQLPAAALQPHPPGCDHARAH